MAKRNREKHLKIVLDSDSDEDSGNPFDDKSNKNAEPSMRGKLKFDFEEPKPPTPKKGT